MVSPTQSDRRADQASHASRLSAGPLLPVPIRCPSLVVTCNLACVTPIPQGASSHTSHSILECGGIVTASLHTAEKLCGLLRYSGSPSVEETRVKPAGRPRRSPTRLTSLRA